ncbi:MAG: DUF4197 family protein [Verrucomicrobia bacterium]|nr:DUF4197 family protein [Verrucomicrobiota bacterium]MDA1066985.1 DUF4197 family protein [Verrucomicrobiota bacterium]
MNKIISNFRELVSVSTFVFIAASLLFHGCGGSKDSASSASSEGKKEAPSAEPTMENMQAAVVDAIQVISKNTVAEITNLAKTEKAIEIPESFEKVQGALAATGNSDLFKGFTSSLNDSAADALGGYKDTISDTISSLNLPDVESIIKGGDDSMTRYLESAASSKLKDSLIPYVKTAVKDYGAQEWIDKIKGALPEDTGGLLGQVSAMTGVNLPTNFDIEGYLTDELMGKFFGVMANQEKLFREDPKGRSAELFKKVMEATAR